MQPANPSSRKRRRLANVLAVLAIAVLLLPLAVSVFHPILIGGPSSGVEFGGQYYKDPIMSKGGDVDILQGMQYAPRVFWYGEPANPRSRFTLRAGPLVYEVNWWRTP